MNNLDSKIITLRLQGYTYTAIQRSLGNPSKKYIRKILLIYDPKLVSGDYIKNYKNQ